MAAVVVDIVAVVAGVADHPDNSGGFRDGVRIPVLEDFSTLPKSA